MLNALLLFCLCGGALAQSPLWRHCPQVVTTPNFDTARYMGRWYESRHYFTWPEFSSTCIAADYTLENDGTIRMVNSKVPSIGKPVSIGATARVPDQANPSKLKVRLDTDPIGIERDYWVLGTDYDTYAVVYNCVTINRISMKFAWILTRELNPPPSVIDKALAVAMSNELRKDRFVTSNQSGCDKLKNFQ